MAENSRPDLLQAEHDAACELIVELRAENERISIIAVRTIEAESAAHGAESRCEQLEADCAALREALGQALRQWCMYAEMNEARDIASEDSPEADLYRIGRVALQDNPGAALLAERDRLREALKWAEAIMSIVEPRSDKAEYLECLAAIRKALED